MKNREDEVKFEGKGVSEANEAPESDDVGTTRREFLRKAGMIGGVALTQFALLGSYAREAHAAWSVCFATDSCTPCQEQGCQQDGDSCPGGQCQQDTDQCNCVTDADVCETGNCPSDTDECLGAYSGDTDQCLCTAPAPDNLDDSCATQSCTNDTDYCSTNAKETDECVGTPDTDLCYESACKTDTDICEAGGSCGQDLDVCDPKDAGDDCQSCGDPGDAPPCDGCEDCGPPEENCPCAG